MRRWACALFLLAACHSKKKADEVPPPAPLAAPPPPPTVSLGRLARESSGLALARVDGALHAFVADEDDHTIHEIDLSSKEILHTTKLAARPRDLLVLGDGRLAVTMPDASAVLVFTRRTTGGLDEAARIATPSEPLAMAVDAKDAALHVTTGASHTVVSFDTKLVEQRRVSLGREPRAVLAEAERVFVTHAIEDFVSVVDADGAVSETPIGNRTMCSSGGRCISARTARHAQAIVRTGENGIVVPVVQVLSLPTQAFSKRSFRKRNFDDGLGDGPFMGSLTGDGRGGYGFGSSDENGPAVISDLPVLDASTGKKWSTGSLPNMGVDCLLPRAAVASGAAVLVACQGSARVVRYRPTATSEDEYRGKFSFDAKGKTDWSSFANGVVPNVKATTFVVGAGPSAMAAGDDGEIFVWSTFARTVSRIRGDEAESLVAIPRVTEQDTSWLAGRVLFHSNDDRRISRDGRACANCHIDGTDDGLAWETPQGHRRTRFLRGQVATGPYGWLGEHKTLKEHVQATLGNLRGKGLPDGELEDLLAYVARMPTPKTRSEPIGNAERGKTVFTRAECSHCHKEGGTDREVHDVGTGGLFMTPTLASAGIRRALGHDGRYRTLDDMLSRTPNMGNGVALDEDDRKALVAYLETL